MTIFTIVLKYWRVILIALLVLAVIFTGIYVRHVFNERDRFRDENVRLARELKTAATMAELTNKIIEAVRQVRIRSVVNVSRIENEKKPEFVDAHPLMLIPAGVLQAVYSGAKGGAAIRAPPLFEGSNHLPTEGAAGGVLPR